MTIHAVTVFSHGVRTIVVLTIDYTLAWNVRARPEWRDKAIIESYVDGELITDELDMYHVKFTSAGVSVSEVDKQDWLHMFNDVCDPSKYDGECYVVATDSLTAAMAGEDILRNSIVREVGCYARTQDREQV